MSTASPSPAHGSESLLAYIREELKKAADPPPPVPPAVGGPPRHAAGPALPASGANRGPRVAGPDRSRTRRGVPRWVWWTVGGVAGFVVLWVIVQIGVRGVSL
jgi:hypothetical protein